MRAALAAHVVVSDVVTDVWTVAAAPTFSKKEPRQ